MKYGSRERQKKVWMDYMKEDMRKKGVNLDTTADRDRSSTNRTDPPESKVRVRALFNYNSSDDPYIPCKEAGLDFKKGDILHIVSQDDAYWWQARREGDRVMRAGLIPSRALQEGRIIHERQTDPQTMDGQ
ncbi:MAGUK p55 subfamily member 7 [Papilio machaon]|uniref:MAGUK p55 subfamily member 7 n=1 Tax=Papilio machaon TaxID=76193 RepID=A0A0N1INL5_PAPMA|nr:MAGUK p55 subfamily member 7 [Papilio machaon]